MPEVEADLAVVMVGGVQRFIGESRSTADVSGASALIQVLLRGGARRVAQELANAPAPCGLIFPAGWGDDVPVSNKIVFLAPVGAGARIAEAAAIGLRTDWRDLVETTFDGAAVPPCSAS